METSLAIYEALIQATVPPSAARRVAECLERDMTSNLATKNDLLLVRQDLEHLEQRMALRFEALESRFTLMNQTLESRVVFKLGALMVVLFGLAGTVLKLVG
jgi:hypothetical protein